MGFGPPDRGPGQAWVPACAGMTGVGVGDDGWGRGGFGARPYVSWGVGVGVF